MAERFYCPDPPVGGRLTLVGGEAHHLARVRRVPLGAVVEVFDGLGTRFRAEVRGLAKDRVDLEVVGDPSPAPMPACLLTLATAVPKGERFDWLVEKATELGVSRLVPLVAERSAVDPRGAKLVRLRRLVVEASKQSGRSRLMDLAEPIDLADYLRTEPAPTRLLAHPGGFAASSWPGIGVEAAVAIGPEGGFTPGEVAAATEAGWTLIGLGPMVLRIETAGLVGCALVMSRTGEGVD